LFKLKWASPLCASTLTATLGVAGSVSLGSGFAVPSRAAVQPGTAPGLAAGNGALTSAASANGLIVGIATIEVAGPARRRVVSAVRPEQLDHAGRRRRSVGSWSRARI
jgi:hypothetical protein